MTTNRTRMLNVRMLESETTMLADLAAREGVSISEWIRNLVRREHAIAFGAHPSPKRSKGKKP